MQQLPWWVRSPKIVHFLMKQQFDFIPSAEALSYVTSNSAVDNDNDMDDVCTVITKAYESPETIMAIVESRGVAKHVGYASLNLNLLHCHLAQVLLYFVFIS